jgi:hypothetical protein
MNCRLGLSRVSQIRRKTIFQSLGFQVDFRIPAAIWMTDRVRSHSSRMQAH